MLSREENELLTKVGRGTPMGQLLRRYWYPIAASSELIERPTKAVRILGEDLVLYRDRQGRPGLIGPQCAHRRMSLLLGIPENDGGIRSKLGPVPAADLGDEPHSTGGDEYEIPG